MLSPRLVRASSGAAIVISVFKQNPAFQRPFDNPAGPGVESERSNACIQSRSAGQRSGYEIVLLDTRGHALTRTDIMSKNVHDGHRPRVWICDLDGDGIDEVIWTDESSRIRAMHAGSEKWHWESKVRNPEAHAVGVWVAGGSVFNDAIRAILPAGKNYPATVVANAKDHLVGLAGTTGKFRWKCEASDAANVFLLETADPLGLPRVCERGEGGQTTCRFALPTDDAGVYLPIAPMDVEPPSRRQIPGCSFPCLGIQMSSTSAC